jgi:hypothetical protein
MSNMARYNGEARLVQIRFASGGRGTPNTYQYRGIGPNEWGNFIAGRLGRNGTATHSVIMGRWQGVRV